MQCHFCQQEKPGLPFRCNFCGDYFCSDHRLPENHACPRVGGPKQPGYSRIPTIQEKYAKSHGHVGLPAARPGRSGIRLGYPGIFSRAERKHIAIASLLMIAVGVSWMYSSLGFFSTGAFVIGAFLFLTSFMGHELAHKFFAQRNGMWAEFRTNTYGLIFTALSIIPIPFKFLAPGVTNVVGGANRELQGAIALIGPGFNVVFGTICVFTAALVGRNPIGYALIFVAAFNGFMGLFNLIPFFGFDGLKAFEWDKTRWAITLSGSIALIVVQYLSGYIL
jgi:Zn-dependent protease